MWPKPERWIAAVATLAVGACAVALLGSLTAGLSLFTSESWRRAEVAAAPRALPAALLDAALQDEQGRALRLADLCGKAMVVDFVYTQCPTVCKALGGVSAQLAQRLAEPIAQGRVEVLSLSFDPARDRPEQLRAFKQASDPHGSGWRLARPLEAATRAALLEQFGVVVIDDGRGGYDHNAGLHIVDRQCRLARVLDLDDIEAAHALVTAQL